VSRSPKHSPDELVRLADQGEPAALERYLDALPGSAAARLISRLSRGEQMRVLTTLAPGDAADLMEEIPETQAAGLLEHLPAADAAAILNEMESDEQADLLTALPRGEAEAILAAMDPAEATDARRLAEHRPDTAGGLMITERLQYPDHLRVRDVADDLQRHAAAYADYDVQYLYVVSAAGELEGVLPLRELLLAAGERPIGALAVRNPAAVRADAPLDELAARFDHHRYLGLPVVDEAGRLLGVVRRHDVEEAIADRAGDDYLKSLGIVGGEELRSMPVLRRSARRLSWLVLNIGLNVLAASVIAFHQDTLAAVIALAVFLPIISDMSGCAGNQAVAVSMRELALGLIEPREAGRVWALEIAVGLLNGAVLGVLLGGVAWLWQQSPFLGLVVGGAMALNTMVAVSLGGVLPLLLKRWGRDPALGSGPILTTLTDLCGFFLVLTFASAMLARLAR
jgi:magnesium transporter